MNKPDIKNYWNDGLVNHEDDYKEYSEALEEYCDELEKKVKLKEQQRQNWEHDYNGMESYYKECLAQRDKVLIEWSEECHEAWRDLEKYKTALNKVGELIEPFTVCIQHNFVSKTKEQWIDWALNNE